MDLRRLQGNSALDERDDRFLHESTLAAWLFPMNTLTEIYHNTTEESCLRRMVVDMYATLAGSSQASKMTSQSKSYPQHFLIDLVKKFIESNPLKPQMMRDEYTKVDMCPSFHVHEEGVSCTKKGKKRSSGEIEEEN